jgi:hypothetical protein
MAQYSRRTEASAILLQKPHNWQVSLDYTQQFEVNARIAD